MRRILLPKILVTGGNGYLGRSISKMLNSSGHFEVMAISRTNVDLMNANDVAIFLKNNGPFNVVIHTAIIGGKRTDIDSPQTTYDNLVMFTNISNCNMYFNSLINIDSGASYDRRNDIYMFHESELLKSYPIDYYGLSKNLIAKTCLLNKNYYNLRIFNVFDPDELDTRFLKTIYNNYINKEEIIVNDCFFDFFSMEDLFTIVQYIILDFCKYNDLNCSYLKKKTLSQIAKYIATNILPGLNYKVSNPETLNKSYCGNGSYLNSLPLHFVGLEQGIKNYYKKLIDG